MAQARGIQTGAYAEALLAEFDAAISEVQEVIDSERNSKDKKIFFLAVEAKKQLLEAKAKALGLGASAGRPGKGTDLPIAPDDISREDLRGVAETYLKAQEVPPPPVVGEPATCSIDLECVLGDKHEGACEHAPEENAPLDADEQADLLREAAERFGSEGVSEGAEDEVAVVDGESSSHSG